MNSPNSLPSVNLIPLLPLAAAPEAPVVVPSRERRSKHFRPTPTDIRWTKVTEFLRVRNLDPNSKRSYERELNRFLAWSELGWGEIKSRHLGHYKQYLVELPTAKGKPRKKSSINVSIAALRSFFRWMKTNYPDQIETNPAENLEFEKIPLPAAQNLTPEQMESIWEALQQLDETRLRDTALIHILRYGGLREEEASNLNIASLLDRVLFLADTKTNEPREVPLPKVAIAAISEYLDWREAQGETLTPDRPLLLSHHPGRQGQRLTPGGIYLAVDRLGKLAGIDELHPHLFRHTYATNLLLNSLDPRHAMVLTGHNDERSFRRYTIAARGKAAREAYFRSIGEEE